jgi:hypothetical protein
MQKECHREQSPALHGEQGEALPAGRQGSNFMGLLRHFRSSQ